MSEITETARWIIPESSFKPSSVTETITATCSGVFNHFYFDLNVKAYYSNQPQLIYSFLCSRTVYLKSVKNIHFTDSSHVISTQSYNDYMLPSYTWHELYKTNTINTKNFEKQIILEFKIIVKGNPETAQSYKPRMISDFENLLRLGSFSDAVIKSTDSKEFKVHKAFLSSRSDVLKAHFEHNTSESITNVLESPFESKVLEEVLTFIYTDQASKVAEMPETLLNAANFYQLDRLEMLSEVALYKKISVENAIEILILADMHSCENLKKPVLQFIEDNITLVMKTQGWIDFGSSEKLNILSEYVMKINKK